MISSSLQGYITLVIVTHRTVQYSTVQYGTVLYCTVLYCAVSQAVNVPTISSLGLVPPKTPAESLEPS